ncbi:hypothetical protein [Mycolicibacterium rhodesiae]|uniref:hypothetical protein n=1 Tax=Mycolicibacterium rhodesiae TaxID=36814 RepID=UPI0013FE4EA0|nr:hypothetical protein [Mycolicibacterium rhodesiae]MCV7348275.1 hypothetical protein [Mycolicibacterium rhodesiae]
MKVDIGSGTPIYVSSRRDGGISLHQGASKIFMGIDELNAVLDAINDEQGRWKATGKYEGHSSRQPR